MPIGPLYVVSKTRRQLIFFWSYVEWGGAQIYLLAIMKQAKHDWNVKVVLPRASSPEIVGFIKAVGVDYDFIDFSLDLKPAHTLKRKLERQWHRIRAELLTFKHLRRYDLRESILHIDAIPWQSWILLFLLTLHGNVFVTIHNALPQAVPKWRRLVWKTRLNFLAGLERFHFFAANQHALDSLKEFVRRDHWSKLKLTRAAIDPVEINNIANTELDRRAILEKHGMPGDKFIVLCVGQFVDRKGRWIFLAAAQKLAEEHQDILFLWLSPKPPDIQERSKIQEYGLNDRFRLVLSACIGTRREDVLNFFRIADIFVLPSLWEGLPIAILEAMALGIPTVSTSVNAIPEAIKDLETGILVKPGDSDALANAIDRIKTDESLRRSLAKSGRDHVLEHFDERLTARIALDAYERCFLTAGR